MQSVNHQRDTNLWGFRTQVAAAMGTGTSAANVPDAAGR